MIVLELFFPSSSLDNFDSVCLDYIVFELKGSLVGPFLEDLLLAFLGDLLELDNLDSFAIIVGRNVLGNSE